MFAINNLRKSSSSISPDQMPPDNDDRFISEVTTPEINNKKKRKKKRSPENFEEDEEFEDNKPEELDEATDHLAQLFEDGEIQMDEVEKFMKYIDSKLAEGVPGSHLARRIRNPSQRNFILKIINSEISKAEKISSQQSLEFSRSPVARAFRQP